MLAIDSLSEASGGGELQGQEYKSDEAWQETNEATRFAVDVSTWVFELKILQ